MIMAKRFSLVMIMILIFGSVAFSQATATLVAPASNPSPGNATSVTLNVQNFTGIGAITFYISYNPDILSFTGLTEVDAQAAGIWFNSSGSTINIVWTAPDPSGPGMTLSDKLCKLNFEYTGPGTSALSFLTSPPFASEVAAFPALNIVPVAYTGCTITAKTDNTQTATLQPQVATTGTEVDIPLVFSGFSNNVGAITQMISFDPGSLTYLGIAPTAGFSTALANVVGNTVAISWTTPTPVTGSNINAPGAIMVRFLYTGSTPTAVNFAPGCIISDYVGGNLNVSYVGTIVSPAGPVNANVALGNISGATQGQLLTVPVNISGFTTNPAAATLYISYDNSVLSYVGTSSVTTVAGAEFMANASNSVIAISYTNLSQPTPPSLNGLLCNLKFVYNGPGSTELEFLPGCEFANVTGGLIAATYTDGLITAGTPGPTATIGFRQASITATVHVPVTFSNLPLEMGAVTMFIDYDESKLTYTGVSANTFGALVKLENGLIKIAWTSGATTPANINGTFLYLDFVYNGGSVGNCGAPVDFAPGCELADFTATPFAANWVNGGVNLRFRVSGYLTYDKSTTLPLANYTILLKDGPEPIPPAITPVPSILYTTTTDATGYFEIDVPNGDYYLYASSTAAWEDVDGADVTQIRRYIALLSNTIGSDVLRQRAADIDQNGVIDGGDITPLRRRIANLTPNPNYKAPDWLFGNAVTGSLHVVVSCANKADQSFQGILSGEVDGSYVPGP